MAAKEKDLTTGPLALQILKFSIPLALCNVLQVLFTMSDVAIVGRYAGPEALGAVGSTTMLVTLFTSFVIGIASGVNVTTARFLGAKQERDVRQTTHTSVVMSIGMGILLLMVGVLLAKPILLLLHTKAELLDGALLYLRIYFLGMPALMLFNCGNAILSAAGNTRTPLVILSSCGVLNVGMNLIFVTVLKMDVAGVALASIIAQYLSAVVIMTLLFTRKGVIGLRFRELRIHSDKLKAVLPLGLSVAVQNSIFWVANLFIQASVNSFDTVMVEGTAAAANADNLIFDMMLAFYTACTSFISQNYGAKKKGRIRKSFLYSMFYAFLFSLVVSMLILIFGRQFLGIFTKDADVVEAGLVRLRIMTLSYAVSAFMDTPLAASRGLGKSAVPTVFVILGSVVFRIAWVYTVFAIFGTVTSLFLLYIFSWSITALAEIIYFAYAYRKQTAGFPE